MFGIKCDFRKNGSDFGGRGFVPYLLHFALLSIVGEKYLRVRSRNLGTLFRMNTKIVKFLAQVLSVFTACNAVTSFF